MLTDTIATAHQRNNPWWEGFPLDRLDSDHRRNRSPLSQYRNLDRFSRSDFKYHYRSVLDNRLYILAAPNGIGKTATLSRVARRFGEEDVIPDDFLFYFPCDKPIFKISAEFPITDAVDWYLQNIYDSYQPTLADFAAELDEPDSDEKEEIYLFLDDVHLIDDWIEQVVTLLESHPELNIVATTPSAEAIESEPFVSAEFSYESDVLLPRKFHDWVTSFDNSSLETSDKIKNLCRDIRTNIGKYATHENVDIESTILDLVNQLEIERDNIERSLARYLQTGDHTRPGADIANNIQMTIFRDIPQVQSIGSPAELHVLAAIAAVDAGNSRTLKDWSLMLDVDRRTLDNYLELLEGFYLVTPSGHYGHDVRRSLRLYPRDPAHIQALGASDRMSSTDTRQRLLMSVLFDHCKRLTFHLNGRNTPVEYWDSGTDIVDFIIPVRGESRPVGIILARDGQVDHAIDAIDQFCDADDPERPLGGFVITPTGLDFRTLNDEHDSCSGILILPAWLFLFIV